MGFLTKLKNWFRGKGYTEDRVELETPPIPVQTEMEKAEELQYKEEPKEERREPEKRTVQDKVQAITPPVKGIETPEMKEAVEKIERAPMTRDVEKSIKPEGENRVKLTQTALSNMNDLKPQYTQIFTENAKITDPDIMGVLYRGRAQLQHRFTAQITVLIDGKIANTLEVVGTLIEHTSLTYNFVNIGMQIDSPPQLDGLLEELGNAYESHYGAISTSLKGRNMHKGKITSIDIDVTFA